MLHLRIFLNHILLSVFVLFVAHTSATTRLVTSLLDSGPFTLRTQIADAFYGDTIKLWPGLITSGSVTILLSSPIVIDKGITIEGTYTATDTFYISENGLTFMFSTTNAGGVFLDSLALIDGKGNSQTNGGGGAIYCQTTDSLVVRHCLFKNNLAGVLSQSYSRGGAILSLTPLIIENSQFISNKVEAYSFAYGGAIYCNQPLKIKSSTFHLNHTNTNNSFSFGGALYCDTDVIISNSTFSANSAKSISNNNGDGGAIYCNANVYIKTSTLTQNLASFGGAIYAVTTNGWVDIENSTIVNNIAASTSFAFWGGISCYNPVLVKSSIIALNGNFNISSGVFSDGNNIFSGVLIHQGLSGMQPTDISVNSNAQLILGALAFNGGPTKTMLPEINSPAINRGALADTSHAQNGPIAGRRDIGAAENCAHIFHDTINACEPHTWIDGNTYSNSINRPFYVYSTPATNGCDSAAVLILDVIEITTTITQLGGTLVADYPFGSYQWLEVDSLGNFVAIPNQTARNYTPWKNGTYAVAIEHLWCKDTTQLKTVNNIGIPETEKLFFSVYPNPSQGAFTIQTDAKKAFELRIFSAEGKQVFQRFVAPQAKAETLHLQLPKGFYYLVLEAENQIYSEKLVIN